MTEISLRVGLRTAEERRDEPGILLRLCFYEPRGGEKEPWINRVVASVSKHYVSHVELLFHDDMAASIFADDTVFFRPRRYANQNYRIKAFTVPAPSYRLVYEYAKSAAERQVGFSNAMMFCGPLVGFRGNSDDTFCSHFVTSALQVGGVPFAMKMDACRTTPSSLYERMNATETVCFDSTAFKLGQAFGL
jgi:hypothetical protein